MKKSKDFDFFSIPVSFDSKLSKKSLDRVIKELSLRHEYLKDSLEEGTITPTALKFFIETAALSKSNVDQRLGDSEQRSYFHEIDGLVYNCIQLFRMQTFYNHHREVYDDTVR